MTLNFKKHWNKLDYEDKIKYWRFPNFTPKLRQSVDLIEDFFAKEVILKMKGTEKWNHKVLQAKLDIWLFNRLFEKSDPVILDHLVENADHYVEVLHVRNFF